ncbi:NAD(P)-dependent oxidoreductase [Lacrimispora sp.]|uniref:NAD(P)-dependent oxidoreductase n=1 Tax=Lacrimispora sp. TaxID=2719234 RepID=UPI0028B1C3B4|nr:NAD(P)-dependent oxidoreductase [Lacrimispora sp.]
MKIAMLEPLAVEAAYLEKLAKPFIEAGHSVSLTTKSLTQEEQLELAKDANAIIIANSPLSPELVDAAKNLKMISVAFTGVDHVPAANVKAKNILVSNAQGYATVSVTELVFGSAIAALRNIIPCDAATREGRTKDGLVGTELFGKTFGIVGFGAIGRSVGKIALAFGCSVQAYDPFLKVGEVYDGVPAVELEELLKTSDIISLHLPLTEETHHLINKERLALLKKSTVLINQARGPVIDSEALATALNTGQIAAAVIDVFDQEPPIPDSQPLLHAKNTVLTPHIGFASKESMIRRADIAFENVQAWLDGEPINVKLGD